MSWVVVGVDAEQRVVALGTEKGQPLNGENAVARVLNAAREDHPRYEWVGVELQPGPPRVRPADAPPFANGDSIMIDTSSTELPASREMMTYDGRRGIVSEARQLPAPQVIILDDDTLLLVNVAYLRKDDS